MFMFGSVQPVAVYPQIYTSPLKLHVEKIIFIPKERQNAKSFTETERRFAGQHCMVSNQAVVSGETCKTRDGGWNSETT